MYCTVEHVINEILRFDRFRYRSLVLMHENSDYAPCAFAKTILHLSSAQCPCRTFQVCSHDLHLVKVQDRSMSRCHQALHSLTRYIDTRLFSVKVFDHLPS